ncbi:hypothetical protein NUW58_g3546 [Xylaria curta]|uniref:Uncharacterized protein n=1 Tax=Xylaria curta TaxID=42375 RepID=A0ACC1PBT3_9PEZI|nr:hypothetical protein NUW58_g3546 [Xylaria curta]
MPEYAAQVPSGLVHPDHLQPPSIPAKPGLRYAGAGNWHPWVVKLKSSGTGFYINLPGTDKDVILTAGHNLVGSDGKRSTELVVMSSDGKGDIVVDNNNVEINTRYFKSPKDYNAVYDYGAIFIPREEGQPPRPGFGFSLMLGIDLKDRGKTDPKDAYLTGNVNVTGYREHTPPGQPDLSTGGCNIHPNQLEYEVETQVGLSGSPVWTAYNGVETVVAIHNHGKNESGKSRGTRLNLRVMRDIFRWAGINRFSKRLRIQQVGAHPDGVYLHFAKDYTIGKDQVGRVYIGPDSMDTTFDVLLAETPPTSRLGELRPCFALMARVPWAEKLDEYEDKGDNWVVWDIDDRKVLLSKDFHPWCLMRLEDAPAGTFNVVIYREGKGQAQEVLMRLKVDTSSLTELEMMLGRQDVDGISFVKAIRGKKYKFDQFCLEG